MDFIKETLKQAEENQSDILAENVEGLLLNIAVQLEMSMKLMSVITNGQMLEKLGINQLKKGMSFAKDFPLSKVMLLEITEEINKNARLLREVVVSELPNGRPEITEYSVKDNRYKISDQADELEKQFHRLIGRISRMQDRAMEKVSKAQKPN